MRLFCLVFLASLCSVSVAAQAHDHPVHRLPASSALMQGVIQESDARRLFDYLHDALRAAAEGREPPAPPPELGKRAEEIASELRAQGTLAALLLLSAVERHLGAALREALPAPRPRPLPPTVPYTAVSDRR